MRYAAAASSCVDVVAFVERRRGAEIFLGQRRVSPRRAGAAIGFAGRGRTCRRPPQRDDLRRRRVQPEIELELALTRRHQRAHDAAERRPWASPSFACLMVAEIGKREKRVGVGAQHRPQDAALHE